MAFGIPGIMPEIVSIKEYDQSSSGELYRKQIFTLLSSNKKKKLVKACEGNWYIRNMSGIETSLANIYITSNYTALLVFRNIKIYLNMKWFSARSNIGGLYSISSLEVNKHKACLLSLSSKIRCLSGYILER